MTESGRYLVWFAKLDRFYRIILTSAVLVGIAAIGASAATDNLLLLLVGLCWIIGGSAVVWAAARYEST